MTEEIWKPVVGFNGLYEVSNFGGVRAPEKQTYHNHSRINITRKQRVFKLKSVDGSGYLRITLTNCGKSKSYSVHRLVAEAFIENPKSKKCVNHKNGVKTDNRVENLEWATHSENTKHAFAAGLQSNKGENHPQHKLTELEVVSIRNIHSVGKLGCRRLAKQFGLDKSTVLDIVNRKSWSHV